MVFPLVCWREIAPGTTLSESRRPVESLLAKENVATFATITTKIRSTKEVPRELLNVEVSVEVFGDLTGVEILEIIVSEVLFVFPATAISVLKVGNRGVVIPNILSIKNIGFPVLVDDLSKLNQLIEVSRLRDSRASLTLVVMDCPFFTLLPVTR